MRGRSSRSDMFDYRLIKYIGSYVAAMAGCDAIVFYRRHRRERRCYACACAQNRCNSSASISIRNATARRQGEGHHARRLAHLRVGDSHQPRS